MHWISVWNTWCDRPSWSLPSGFSPLRNPFGIVVKAQGTSRRQMLSHHRPLPRSFWSSWNFLGCPSISAEVSKPCLVVLIREQSRLSHRQRQDSSGCRAFCVDPAPSSQSIKWQSVEGRSPCCPVSFSPGRCHVSFSNSHSEKIYLMLSCFSSKYVVHVNLVPYSIPEVSIYPLTLAENCKGQRWHGQYVAKWVCEPSSCLQGAIQRQELSSDLSAPSPWLQLRQNVQGSSVDFAFIIPPLLPCRILPIFRGDLSYLEGRVFILP